MRDVEPVAAVVVQPLRGWSVQYVPRFDLSGRGHLLRRWGCLLVACIRPLAEDCASCRNVLRVALNRLSLQAYRRHSAVPL